MVGMALKFLCVTRQESPNLSRVVIFHRGSIFVKYFGWIVCLWHV
jgi:hypothetical protein